MTGGSRPSASAGGNGCSAGWWVGGAELRAGLRGGGPRRERRLLLLGWAAGLDRLG
jgi:hypothetical protein